MRGYLIDTKTDQCEEVEVEPSLKSYYKLLDCDCIDIVIRWINSTPFNIVLDDEGLLKPNRISGVNLCCEERLAGNLLIFGVEHDTLELRGLKSCELSALESRTVQGVFNDGSEHPVFWYDR